MQEEERYSSSHPQSQEWMEASGQLPLLKNPLPIEQKAGEAQK
jgi:hypothetical protein